MLAIEPTKNVLFLFPFSYLYSSSKLTHQDQEGRKLSPESTRLFKYLEADLTTSQYAAIYQAKLYEQIMTVSQILKGISN